MATTAQIIASLQDAQAQVLAGDLNDAQMLAIARLAAADMMRGRTTSYSVGGRSFGFTSVDSALKAVEYFQQRIDGGSNAIASLAAEL